MTALPSFVTDSYAHRLGWTLIHSLWQGAILAGLLTVVLRFMRSASSNARYAAACIALATMVTASAITFLAMHADAPAPAVREHAFFKPMNGPVQTEAIPAPIVIESPKPVAAPDTLLPSVVSLWICGVALLSLWHVAGWLWLQRMRISAPSARIDVAPLAARLGITRIIRLIDCARVDVPAVIGALRPVILLPIGMLNDLGASQIEAILIHELAHIRRHDYLVNLVQTAIETLLFYHPAVWWISAQIRRERENACDDIAIAITGDAITYAEALTALETRRVLGKLAVAADGGSLIDRVRRVLRLPSRGRSMRSLAAAVLAIACCAAPIVMSCARKQSTPMPAAVNATLEPSRQPGRIYVIVQSYPREATASEARDLLNRAGIECTIERDVPGVMSSWFTLVGSKGFDSVHTREFEAYIKSIDEVSARAAKNAPMKHFEPHGIKWDQVADSSPAQRPIAVGDVLQIAVDAPEHARAITASDVQVRRDGTILLGLHQMKVAGLTPQQAERAIEQACRDTKLIAEPKASVTLARERVITGTISANPWQLTTTQVFIPNATQPVATNWSGTAGTGTLVVSGTKIYSGTTTLTGTSGTITFAATVPSTRSAETDYYVEGRVSRPGAYALNGPKITVKQAIAAAGGIEKALPEAFVTIIRHEDGKFSYPLQEVPFTEIARDPQKDVKLHPGDFVRVSEMRRAPATQRAATKPVGYVPGKPLAGFGMGEIPAWRTLKEFVAQSISPFDEKQLEYSIDVTHADKTKDVRLITKDRDLLNPQSGKLEDLTLKPHDKILLRKRHLNGEPDDGPPASVPPATQRSQLPVDFDKRVEQIARSDSTMRQYLETRTNVEMQLTQLSKEGLGENHRLVQKLKQFREQTNKQIEMYYVAYAANGPPPHSADLESLRSQRVAVETQLAVSTKTYGENHRVVKDLRKMLDAIDRKIDELSRSPDKPATTRSS